MNQQCKVCGEPAAGFHFGAFTCEGCKSFFGRSYNNLSSISECKNNGECIINKKNRTACKACRLRKCLMVGMSKSGSRYGRRSNWFKIHCLLQEQQQAAQQHQQQQQQGGNHQKTPQQVGMHPGMFHGAYPHGMYPRPPCTKEELMLLGLEEYSKHPSASPSVSSPDSHNSDSSNEINDRRNALLRQGKLHHEAAALSNKDLFLPLPFGGLPLMPPPGFLPSSHLMFPGFHPALYSHPQAGLLKPADSHLTLPSSPLANNNNSRFTPNHNTEPSTHPVTPGSNGNANESATGKSPDPYAKRFILDQVLESQRCPSNGTANGSDKEEPEPEDVGPATMTPPRSPIVVVSQPSSIVVRQHTPESNNHHHHHHHHHHHQHQRQEQQQPPPALHQDNPIDLSMKTGSSCTSADDRRSSMSGAESNGSDDENHAESRSSSGLDKYKYAVAAAAAAAAAVATGTATGVAGKTTPNNNNNNNNNNIISNNHEHHKRHQPSSSPPPAPARCHEASLTPSPTQQRLASPPQPESPPLVRSSVHHRQHHHQHHHHHLHHLRHRHAALAGHHHGSGSESDLEPEETEYEREVKRMKLQGTTPLDLTTKV